MGFGSMDLGNFGRQLQNSLTSMANSKGVQNTAGLDKLAGALSKIADSNNDGQVSQSEQTSFNAVMGKLGDQLFANGGQGINFAQMASALEQNEGKIEKNLGTLGQFLPSAGQAAGTPAPAGQGASAPPAIGIQQASDNLYRSPQLGEVETKVSIPREDIALILNEAADKLGNGDGKVSKEELANLLNGKALQGQTPESLKEKGVDDRLQKILTAIPQQDQGAIVNQAFTDGPQPPKLSRAV